MNKEKKIPIYQIIFNELLEKITDGFYKVGEKIPTEKELMSQYQTSRITASRAVRELESRNYVQRNKASGTFVTPVATWTGNSIFPKSTKPGISIIVPSPSSNISFEMDVLQGIGIACRSMGYVMNIQSNDSTETESKTPYDFEKELTEELLNQGSVGAIIFPSTLNESPEIYNLMFRNSIPFVLMDRAVFGIDAPIVTADNHGGFYSIVEHVISKGHRKIAFVSGNTHETSCRTDRYYGFVKAMNDNKIPIEDRFIVHHLFPENYDNRYYRDIEGIDGYYHNAIVQMLNNFINLDDPPTVLVTSNDYIALKIMSVATGMGIRIPEDISISGFDGLPVTSLVTPKLTTVEQDFLGMGKTAIELLDKIIKNPQRKIEKIEIPTKLLIADSVKQL